MVLRHVSGRNRPALLAQALQPELLGRYGFAPSSPVLLLFKNGSVVAKRIGPATKNDVLKLIDPYL